MLHFISYYLKNSALNFVSSLRGILQPHVDFLTSDLMVMNLSVLNRSDKWQRMKVVFEWHHSAIQSWQNQSEAGLEKTDFLPVQTDL